MKKLSPQEHTIETMSYWKFINLVTDFVKVLQENKKLNVPHPWYNVLIPEHQIGNHLEKVLHTPLLTGSEPIIIYPLNASMFQRNLFIKPDSPTFYLLGVLYNTSLDAKNDFPYDEILIRNKILYENVKNNGG